MENVGTGRHDTLLNFEIHDDKITKENFLILFKFSIVAGSTPYMKTIFMFDSYNLFPVIRAFLRMRLPLPTPHIMTG